jgi:hypothetical protein
VDDLNARKVGWQRLTSSAAFGRRHNLYFCGFVYGLRITFNFVENAN